MAYLSNQTLNSPFSPPTSFGTTTLLQNVTVTGLGLGHTFEYAASGSGELTPGLRKPPTPSRTIPVTRHALFML
jgi:hypothetical protein